MKLLGLETSSALGSVALLAGERVLERTIPTPREQTEQMLGLVDELLREAGVALGELDAIAYGRGPGSFTGLRVSVAVAQGLAVVSGVPLVPVSSLACLAERAWREHSCARALVCVDAHMGELYEGAFVVASDVVEASGPERLVAPAEVLALPGGGWCAVGGAFASHAGPLGPVLARAERALPDLMPLAQYLFPAARRDLEAGRTIAPTAALPVYLREQTAWRRQS
jgi:tRNA threonylcarbamoyladenosine biosynthesis protein TsaB